VKSFWLQLWRLQGNGNDLEVERMEAVSAAGPRREYRSPDNPRNFRSPYRRLRRAAFLRCGRQCRPGARLAAGRLKIMVRPPRSRLAAGAGIPHLRNVL